MNAVLSSPLVRAGWPWAVAVLAASTPFWFIQTTFMLTVITHTLIIMAAAIAWNIISGFGGQLSFGHSAFYGLGAYTAVLAFTRAGVTPWLGMVLGGLVAVAAALVIGVPTFRLRGIYFTLATFTTTLILAILAGHFDGLTGGHVGISVPFLRNSPGNMQFGNKLWFFYLALAFVVVFFVIARGVYRSRLGYALRAIRDDEEAAEASGVRVLRTKLVALSLSAFLTAIAGVLALQFTLFIDPEGAFGASTAVEIALPAIVGGLGTLWGPVLGALVLVPTEQVLTDRFAGSRAGLALLVYAVLIIAIVLADRGGVVSLLRRGARRLIAVLPKGSARESDRAAASESKPTEEEVRR